MRSPHGRDLRPPSPRETCSARVQCSVSAIPAEWTAPSPFREPYEECAFLEFARALRRRIAHGCGAESVPEPQLVEQIGLTPIQRLYLSSIIPEKDQAESACAALQASARRAFLSGVSEKCTPGIHLPRAWALRELRKCIVDSENKEGLPVTIETQVKEAQESGVDLTSPALIRDLDKWNLCALRLRLGFPQGSIFVRTLSASPELITPGSFQLNRRWAGAAIPAPIELGRGEEVFQALAEASPAVFRVLPPPENQMVFNLAAASLGSGGAQAECAREQDRAFIAFASPLVTASPPVPAGYLALKLGEFMEKNPHVIYAFEDLFSGLCLAQRAAALLRGQGEAHVIHAGPPELDDLIFRNLADSTPSLLNRRDLSDLELRRGDLTRLILDKTSQAQLLGLLSTRPAALSYARMLAAAEGAPITSKLDLAHRSGSELAKFVRVVELSDLSAAENYSVRRFGAISRPQFPGASGQDLRDAVLAELRQTKNYPALETEMEHFGVTEDTLTAWFRDGEVQNLVELETLCEMLQWQRDRFEGAKGNLVDVLHFTHSTSTYALVRRAHDADLGEIGICVGYQGKAHVGQGLRHLLEQRKDVIEKLKAPNESLEQAEQRFVAGVMHVAGAGRLKTPTERHSDSHLLLSGPALLKKDSAETAYLTLILARELAPDAASANRYQLVTAIYHRTGQVLRDYLLTRLKGWTSNGNGEDLPQVLAQLRRPLLDYGIGPIEQFEVVPPVKLARTMRVKSKLSEPPELSRARGYALGAGVDSGDACFGIESLESASLFDEEALPPIVPAEPDAREALSARLQSFFSPAAF